MEIDGKTSDGSAYRVTETIGGRRVTALVSDALLSSDFGRSGKVGHQEAYEWIAGNQHALVDAMTALVEGRTPRAPFDQIALAKE